MGRGVTGRSLAHLEENWIRGRRSMWPDREPWYTRCLLLSKLGFCRGRDTSSATQYGAIHFAQQLGTRQQNLKGFFGLLIWRPTRSQLSQSYPLYHNLLMGTMVLLLRFFHGVSIFIIFRALSLAASS